MHPKHDTLTDRLGDLMNILSTATLCTVILSFTPIAHADDDENFLKPENLPRTAEQWFHASGQGTIPTFPEGYGIEKAIKNNHAERVCKSKTGVQLTPWIPESKTDGFYWDYSISARFECLPPTLQTSFSGVRAATIYDGLAGISEVEHGSGVTAKASKTLCYEFLSPVCESGRLQRYKNHTVCELHDMNTPSDTIRIEDIYDRDSSIVHGALELSRSLPIYTDGRRDDESGGNCDERRWNKLKGLSRKAAKINCIKRPTGATACFVEGIIQSN